MAVFKLSSTTPAPKPPLGDRLAYDTLSSELTLVATEVAGSSRADLANAVIAAHSGARARVLLKEERVAA
ncbi:hypothetical protein [Methylocystis parvus]|uniref:hypothetical protein n=1 Tax=Methylocystis parvus TaxID=134 RepID=UPI003C768B64